jgi:hypothetical protein
LIGPQANGRRSLIPVSKQEPAGINPLSLSWNTALAQSMPFATIYKNTIHLSTSPAYKLASSAVARSEKAARRNVRN